MKEEKPRYILDTFALLAYLHNEPGGPRVQALLSEAKAEKAELFLCLINYGEALYIIERWGGVAAVRTAIVTIDNLPITVVEPDRDLCFAAAHIKALYPVSYADAFTIALAQKLGATVVTGDPEFRKVEALIRIEWLVKK